MRSCFVERGGACPFRSRGRGSLGCDFWGGGSGQLPVVEAGIFFIVCVEHMEVERGGEEEEGGAFWGGEGNQSPGCLLAEGLPLPLLRGSLFP